MESTYDLDWFHDIPGYEGLYMINGYGEVYSFLSQKILRHWQDDKGTHKPLEYLSVHLMKDGRRVQHKIHRLVCQVFHGDAPDGSTCVLHLDGNSLNNHPGNLTWGTQSQNMYHSYEHGRTPVTHMKGEGNVSAVLTERKVRVIRGLHKLGYNYNQLANMFHCHKSCIGRVVRRETWANVDDRIDNRV